MEQRLAVDPDALEPRFTRAELLAALGRDDDARADYMLVLRRDASHLGALNDLGTLLHRTGFRTAARTTYAQAVACHPTDATARVNLANVLFESGDCAAARDHYAAALQADPAHREAHQGLARVFAELGEDDAADRHRRLGFQDRFLTALPYRGSQDPIRVLMLVSALGGNIPTRLLLDDRVFATWAVITEFYDPRVALPPHDLVFNAVGDADLCAAALVAADAMLAGNPAPILNPPARVRPTGRVDTARRLAGLARVVAPKMADIPRGHLTGAAATTILAQHGLGVPLLLRSRGFHTGRHFLRVERAEDLAAAVAALPGEELTAIEYLDARGTDGKARKYRVMIIDGQIYPLHLAISADWKVHYFTADMAEHAAHRAEEARFLENMAGVIGSVGLTALKGVHDRMQLDYMGIDFGLNDRGEILLFEANATMVINPPEPDERWAHRRAPVERALAAVRALLMRMARAPRTARPI